MSNREEVTSPWYEMQQKERSAMDLAQNVDMNHKLAGRMFFPATEIEKHRVGFQEEARYAGDIEYIGEYAESKQFHLLRNRHVEGLEFVQSRDGPFRFWGPLTHGRPDQTHSYTLGIDISAGTGSSNSIITVFDVTVARVIGKYVSAVLNPFELAKKAAQIGVWVGGVLGCALLNYEVNGGVGAQFTSQIKKVGYRPQYKRRNYAKRDRPKTNKLGWYSTPETKEDLLANYRNGLVKLDIINPCKESLDEALTYAYDDIGRLVPGMSGVDESSGAKATHGDHVIADALAFLAVEDVTTKAQAPVTIPADSFEGIRRRIGRKNSDDSAWRVDF